MTVNLSDLTRGMTREQIHAMIADMPDMVAQTLLDDLDHTSQGIQAATPSELAATLDDTYRSLPHLDYLSTQLADALKNVEAGRSQRFAVSMPPRSGKSTLVSLYLPTWILSQHPDWNVGMISHEDRFATLWGRQVRRLIERTPALGVHLASDLGAASEWETTEGGGILSRSIGGSIMGRGLRVVILDDLIKDSPSAHSATVRNDVWDRWLSTIMTRMEPPYLIVALGCLTAETPVLMADGTERAIYDVCPGDRVATYEDGKLTESFVTTWADQGPDYVYAVRLVSGRIVKANGKHPFLTIDDGIETWTRTDNLKPGHIIKAIDGGSTHVESTIANGLSIAAKSARDTTTGSGATAGTSPTNQPIGGNGETSNAAKTNAADSLALKDSANRITTLNDGQTDTVDKHPKKPAAHTSNTGTGSSPKTTTACLNSKTDDALSANENQIIETQEGVAYCLSTTATTATRFEVYSATTATSSSVTALPSRASRTQSNTYELTTDTVTSVTLIGQQHVYDLEVDRTHNFVANGLITHNTRWHEDDYIGRLLSDEHEGDPSVWHEISFPAIATHDDVLGRHEGQPLYTPVIEETESEALHRWDETRQIVGSYTWSALYQQAPAPAEGQIFNMDWVNYYRDHEKPGDFDRVLTSWDCAFKDNPDSDYVVGQVWGTKGADRYLLHQVRGRWSFTDTLEAMRSLSGWADEHLVEDKANGPAVLNVLKTEIPGMIPVNPTTSKEARARAVTPQFEAGNIYLPHPADADWVRGLTDELRSFPSGPHDDQVDSLTQALTRLRSEAGGHIMNPNQRRHAIR